MTADPKPPRRIVDAQAKPLDGVPRATGTCPLCGRGGLQLGLTRHHVVPKGQGGDDVPENLIWACGDGTRGCHGVLTHRNRGDHGFGYEYVSNALIVYLERSWGQRYRSYVAAKKHDGWLRAYYLGAESVAA